MSFPIQDFPFLGHCHLRTEHCIGGGRQKPDDAPVPSHAVVSGGCGRGPAAAVCSRRLSPCSSAACSASAMALVNLGFSPAGVEGFNEAGLCPIQALSTSVVLMTYWTSLVNTTFAVFCLMPGLGPLGSCSWLPGIFPCCSGLVSVTLALIRLLPTLVPCLLLYSFALACTGSLASSLYREAESAPYAGLGVSTKIFTGELRLPLLPFQKGSQCRPRILFLAISGQVPKRLATCQSAGLGPAVALYAAPGPVLQESLGDAGANCSLRPGCPNTSSGLVTLPEALLSV